MAEYTLQFASSYLGGPIEVTALLPEPDDTEDPEAFYRSGEKYQVLWMLHGGKNSNRDWLYSSGIADYVKKYRFMAVIPNGLNSDFANHPEFGDGFFYSDFFFRELMPMVHRWLPASPRREDNFLTGYSMGCAASWVYGTMRPECFGGVIPLSSPPADYRYLEEYRGLSAQAFRELVKRHPEKFHAGYGRPGLPMHQKEVNMIAKYGIVGDFLDSPECVWSRLEEYAGSGRTAGRAKDKQGVQEAGQLEKGRAGCGENETLPRFYVPGNRDRSMERFQAAVQDWGIGCVHFEYMEGDAHCFAFWDEAVKKAIAYFHIGRKRI